MRRANKCFLMVVSTISALGVVDVAWDFLRFGVNPKYGPLGNVFIAIFEIGVFTICGVVCGAIVAVVIDRLTPPSGASFNGDAIAPTEYAALPIERPR